METMNHECYVSLEVAKLLKEAGFDWECTDKYERSIIACRYEDYEKPTLSVAQRWLRVVKGIHLYVRPILDEHKYVVTVVVDDLTWGQVNDNNGTSKRFNTYEEAQEAGIKKALEIILEQGE